MSTNSSSNDSNTANSSNTAVFDEMNNQIIEEFRAHSGKVNSRFEGKDVLLLHTIGAKSNRPRVNPLAYFKDGDHIVIVASKGGLPNNPDWYYNILAHPEVTLEVGTESFKAYATVPESQERDRIFADVVKQSSVFGEYEQKTSRIIPIILLKRV